MDNIKKHYPLIAIGVFALLVIFGIYWYSSTKGPSLETIEVPIPEPGPKETETPISPSFETPTLETPTEPGSLPGPSGRPVPGPIPGPTLGPTPTPTSAIPPAVLNELENELDTEQDSFSTNFKDMEGLENDASMDGLDSDLGSAIE